MEQPKFIPLGNRRNNEIEDEDFDVFLDDNSLLWNDDEEYENDLRTEELYNRQKYLVQKIYNEAKVNTVTCGSCGEVFFHEVDEEELICPHCDYEGEICDFPDLYA